MLQRGVSAHGLARDFIVHNRLPVGEVAVTLATLYVQQTAAGADGWRAWSDDVFAAYVRLCDEPALMGKLLLDVSLGWCAGRGS